MITIRKSKDRGHFNHGWLETYHSFSFGEYYNPMMMGFRSLRVINEDVVMPGQGFGTHQHRDMEIITYVLEGMLAHKDSMGNGSQISPGEVQYMSAGTGVTHSEFNASNTERVKLVQIWIVPDRKGHTPTYDQKEFPRQERENKLKLIVSQTGESGSITVRQDMKLFASILTPDHSCLYETHSPLRAFWVQVLRGTLTVNGVSLEAGDGAAISSEMNGGVKIEFKTTLEESEFLFFDLA